MEILIPNNSGGEHGVRAPESETHNNLTVRACDRLPVFDLSEGSGAIQGILCTHTRDFLPSPVFNKSVDCRTLLPSGRPASMLLKLGQRFLYRLMASPRRGSLCERLYCQQFL